MELFKQKLTDHVMKTEITISVHEDEEENVLFVSIDADDGETAEGFVYFEFSILPDVIEVLEKAGVEAMKHFLSKIGDKEELLDDAAVVEEAPCRIIWDKEQS